MKNPFIKILAFQRLQKINDKKKEIEHFENLIFDNWKHRGSLTYSDRLDAIKKVVEKIKSDAIKKAEESHKKSTLADKNSDKAKSISFYGML